MRSLGVGAQQCCAVLDVFCAAGAGAVVLGGGPADGLGPLIFTMAAAGIASAIGDPSRALLVARMLFPAQPMLGVI